MNETKKELIIANGTCNGEEEQFADWMRENHPDIETTVENTLNDGYFEDGELITNGNEFWDEYC